VPRAAATTPFFAAVQSVFPELGVRRENFVVISGIGCSSRFPYYMKHVRLPHHSWPRTRRRNWLSRLPTPNLKSGWSRETVTPWPSVATTPFTSCAANVGIKVLLFNNRHLRPDQGPILAHLRISKGHQSTPYGSPDRPFNPISLAIGAEATFVGPSVDIFQAHPERHSARRRCPQRVCPSSKSCRTANIFNDGAWNGVTEKDARSEHVIQLEHAKPLIFGKARDKGIRRKPDGDIEVVPSATASLESDLIVHDAHHPRPSLRFLLSHMEGQTTAFPPTHRCPARLDDLPRYEDVVNDQVAAVIQQKGPGNLNNSSAAATFGKSSNLAKPVISSTGPRITQLTRRVFDQSGRRIALKMASHSLYPSRLAAFSARRINFSVREPS